MYISSMFNDVPLIPKLVRNEPTEPFDCFPVTEEELKDVWVEYFEFIHNKIKD